MISTVFAAATAITLPSAGWSVSTHAALQALIDRSVSVAHGHSPVAAFDADGRHRDGDRDHRGHNDEGAPRGSCYGTYYGADACTYACTYACSFSYAHEGSDEGSY